MDEWVFHEDPGHGWLEVPKAHLRRVGVAGKISGYSYQRGDKAYLEEDMDAGTFAKAWAEQEGPIDWERVRRLRSEVDAPLRSFDHYWEDE